MENRFELIQLEHVHLVFKRKIDQNQSLVIKGDLQSLRPSRSIISSGSTQNLKT